MLSMMFNQVDIITIKSSFAEGGQILMVTFPVPWIQGGQAGAWKARHCIC